MSVFVDTSALMAITETRNVNHRRASATCDRLVCAQNRLVTSNYIMVETFSLLQRRVGVSYSRRLTNEVLPKMSVGWVNEPLYDVGVASILPLARRDLSLVGCVRLEVMRRHGIRQAFAFAEHFAQPEFECLP